MLKYIDTYIQQTPMYVLVLVLLKIIVLCTVVGAFFGLISFNPWSLVVHFFVIVMSMTAFQMLASYIFGVPHNRDSVYITGLILYLVLLPSFSSTPWTDGETILVTMLAGAIAIFSKYIIAPYARHMFNPAAFALAVIGIIGFGYSGWWVGTPWVTIPVFLAVIIIARKVRATHMIATYLLLSSVILFFAAGSIQDAWALFIAGPYLFLAGFMLTEPFTSPRRKKHQYVYAGIVALVAGVPWSFGPLHNLPEIALCIGNIYAYIVSTKKRIILTHASTTTLAPDTYEYVFIPNHKVDYVAGQYAEFMLPHTHEDIRSSRRYFTIASAPHEEVIRIGVRHVPTNNPEVIGSSYKKQLQVISNGDHMYMEQIGGDFVLPSAGHVVCIAGGIGITPFISMMRSRAYIAKSEHRPSMQLIYCTKNINDCAYDKDIASISKDAGVQVEHVHTDMHGFLTAEKIKKIVPDYAKAVFFLSGPPSMVNAYKRILIDIGIRRGNIHTDYFPGY